jgi:hypothetical protein
MADADAFRVSARTRCEVIWTRRPRREHALRDRRGAIETAFLRRMPFICRVGYLATDLERAVRGAAAVWIPFALDLTTPILIEVFPHPRSVVVFITCRPASRVPALARSAFGE